MSLKEMLPEYMTEFPEMGRADLRDLKKGIDQSFRTFTRENGEAIENFFYPLKMFMVWFEKLLLGTPWPLMIAVLCLLVWLGARSITMVIGTAIALLVIGYLGMWEDTMRTLALVSVSTFVCIAIGIPVGILMSKSDRIQAVIVPILDIMQTIPAFVYLIPVLMLLGIGKVPGLIAVCIYAIPPVVRLTNLGIRLVDKDVLEAADAFGASPRQKMMQVQLPLALPNLFAGVNQTIMMALAMVVVASLIGAHGLGSQVLKAVYNQYLTHGMMNGLAIVTIAIVFDRVSQKFGKRLQKHSEKIHG
ncbi:ABC transporter permease [Profundibacter amoris]|uniref:Proline/glycine betaine ABC transporter permease n=1 Tax=Profundibacter amoris TaxID=2171755 RepID=A0A347UCF3_9RHOB|nr:proline/glycine betaine ABC transporter permease [Profundibacter amoris]AXX96531.1 proline/glycine betaine ABC transporter permease [Profundibacter amoris]